MEQLHNLEPLGAALGGSGVFVTAGETPNTMTASWGGVGVMWNRPLLAIPVRGSRFTYGKIEESGAFSVSVPAPGRLQKELGFFGTKSGRDLDKYAATGIVPAACRKIGTFVVPGCAMYYECRVLYRMDVKPELLPEGYISSFYHDHDYHTVYYGEILAAYQG